MTKLIHTQSKIFFSNPRVVMVEHEKEDLFAFSKLTRKVYRTIQGTWGHSLLEYEYMNMKYKSDFKLRSYWCFKDELDDLQFRLMIGEKAQRVYMWPERLFIIHELVEKEG